MPTRNFEDAVQRCSLTNRLNPYHFTLNLKPVVTPSCGTTSHSRRKPCVPSVHGMPTAGSFSFSALSTQNPTPIFPFSNPPCRLSNVRLPVCDVFELSVY